MSKLSSKDILERLLAENLGIEEPTDTEPREGPTDDGDEGSAYNYTLAGKLYYAEDIFYNTWKAATKIIAELEDFYWSDHQATRPYYVFRIKACWDLLSALEGSGHIAMGLMQKVIQMVYDDLTEQLIELSKPEPFMKRRLKLSDLLPVEIDILKLVLENRRVLALLDEEYGLLVDAKWESHIAFTSANDDWLLDESDC